MSNVRHIELWPKQLAAFESPATEILFGGAAGPGKSYLMRVWFLLACAEVPGLQCYLFRRRYGDLIKNHLEGPTGLRALVAELFQGYAEVVDLEVRFANGSRIFLCHCQHEHNVENYRGAEMHFLGIEEATQFTEYMIRFLRTRVRMPREFKEKIPARVQGRFPRILYTSNPGGPGHHYFKKWFIDVVPAWDIWDTPDSEGGFKRQFIPAKLVDNPSIQPEEYRKALRGLGTPEMVRALEDGDWSAVVGAYFGSVWSLERHVCKPFQVPAHWYKFRSFDWGSYKPFAVLWFAVSDGEPVTFWDGTTGRFPRGCLVVYREWYGCVEGEADRGIALSNEEMAKGIKAKTAERDVKITLTDSLPFQERGNKGAGIADVFAAHGVPLTMGDTSRIPGWQQCYSRLVGNDEGPMVVIAEHCVHLIRTLPTLQRSLEKPEDVADGQEDHAPDAFRLGCNSRPIVREVGKPEILEVKPEALQVSKILEKHFRTRRMERYG